MNSNARSLLLMMVIIAAASIHIANGAASSLTVLNALPYQGNVDVLIGGQFFAKNLAFNEYATYYGSDLVDTVVQVQVATAPDTWPAIYESQFISLLNDSHVVVAIVQIGKGEYELVEDSISANVSDENTYATVAFLHLAFGTTPVDFIVGAKTVAHYVPLGSAAQTVVQTGKSALTTQFAALVNGEQYLTTSYDLAPASIALVTLTGNPGATQINAINLLAGTTNSASSLRPFWLWS